MSARPGRRSPVPLRSPVREPVAPRRGPMELRDYLEVLARRKWVILAVLAIVVGGVALVSTYVLTKKYTGTTTLRVVTPSSLSSDIVRASDLEYLDRLENTYAKIATSPPLIAALRRKLALTEKPDVNVSVRANTELMELAVAASKPAVAASASNTLADLLIARIRFLDEQTVAKSDRVFTDRLVQLEEQIVREQQQIAALEAKGDLLTPAERSQLIRLRESVRIRRASIIGLQDRYEQDRIAQASRANTISVVLPATRPTNPSSPRVKLNIAVGLFVGLLGGIALAFLLENLSTRVQSSAEIQETAGTQVLSMIPTTKFTSREPLLNGGSPAEEAFRRLRTTLFTLGQSMPLKSVLVTSAEQNEGKSTIVSNLGVSIAMSGHRVLIVDGDLRIPSQHGIFDLPNGRGLSEVLRGEIPIDEALETTSYPGLFLLPAGDKRDSDPTELLRTGMPSLIARLTNTFEIVLIDSPALLPVADGLALAPQVDGVLMVAGQAQTHRAALQQAVNELARFDVSPIGVVVNRTDEGRAYSYYA
jgi:polysaccharide biosynthesis transport protein